MAMETVDEVIELPWNETHRYAWSKDQIIDGPLESVCQAYGYSVSEFDDEGEIDSGTQMCYKKTPTGPNHWKKLAKRVSVVLILAIVVLLVVL